MSCVSQAEFSMLKVLLFPHRCESSADDYDYRACVFDADVVAAYQISEQRFLECMGPEQQ